MSIVVVVVVILFVDKIFRFFSSSLGMLHDGYDNNCESDKYIMSEKTGPGKIHWSPCSNLYLENFLK